VIFLYFSLQTIAQDVKETQEDVDQLDERVTGTEGAVENLATRVDEHDDNVQELAETIDTVTQRVDFAEKDIEETKIKVEEVDNKVYYYRKKNISMNKHERKFHIWNNI
jgi:uncharacterized protein YoxC